MGFIIAITMQYSMLSYTIKIGACALNFAIGAYLYLIAMSKCIKQNLFAICRNTRSKDGGEQILIQPLIEYIEFYSRVKR